MNYQHIQKIQRPFSNIETMLRNWLIIETPKEAEKKLPLSYEFVTSTTKNKCKFVTAKQALVLSSILNSWISKSLFVYRNNVLLISAGCKGEEIECFQRLGLCSHKNKGFDQPVAEWKAGLEDNREAVFKKNNVPKQSQAVNVDVCNEPQTLATGYRCVKSYFSLNIMACKFRRSGGMTLT